MVSNEKKTPTSLETTMHILADFVVFALGFVPFLMYVAILLVLFWIATKVFPSLGEWMNRTDDVAETEYEQTEYDYDYHHRPIDYRI
jgi:hypothetical protein